MEFDYRMLRRRIREKHMTEAEFARAMRMSNQSLRKKLRNEGDFTHGQILKAAKLLEIDAAAIPMYFFVEKVQKTELFVEAERKTAPRCSGYMQ